MFPDSLTIALADWANSGIDWVVVNYGDYFEAFANSLLFLLVGLEQFPRNLPWWLVVLVVAPASAGMPGGQAACWAAVCSCCGPSPGAPWPNPAAGGGCCERPSGSSFGQRLPHNTSHWRYVQVSAGSIHGQAVISHIGLPS